MSWHDWRASPAVYANKHVHQVPLQRSNAVWFVTGERQQCISTPGPALPGNQPKKKESKLYRVGKPWPRFDTLAVHLPDPFKCSWRYGQRRLVPFRRFVLTSICGHIRALEHLKMSPGESDPHASSLRLGFIHNSELSPCCRISWDAWFTPGANRHHVDLSLQYMYITSVRFFRHGSFKSAFPSSDVLFVECSVWWSPGTQGRPLDTQLVLSLKMPKPLTCLVLHRAFLPPLVHRGPDSLHSPSAAGAASR